MPSALHAGSSAIGFGHWWKLNANAGYPLHLTWTSEAGTFYPRGAAKVDGAQKPAPFA